MRTFSSTTLMQGILALTIAVVGAAWWLTVVPGLLRSSTFIALMGFLAGSAWVLKNTLESAQPASSLAQALYDVETTAAAKRARSRSIW